MGIRTTLSGNEAAATAMKQINPDVVAAYPITPSTEIVEYFSQAVADGEVDTELITVESEHSALSACVGASAAGARVMTATSSNGLALMFEITYIASSMRLPIVMNVVNRTLSGPICIQNDHSDSMGTRDAGWIQIYSEDNQEAYDNTLQAIRIAENENVLLPVMVCQDGFIISHSVENIELLEDEKVKDFVGEYISDSALLNKKNPVSHGPYCVHNYYFENKYQQAEAFNNAKEVVLKVADEFEKLSGRKYSFFETYQLEDAEVALVLIGSTAGTAKETVDMFRRKGVKVGLLKIRLFRPFPAEEIKNALAHLKSIAIMDKSEGFSTAGGPLFHEVRAALFDLEKHPKTISYIYGVGGRDVTVHDIEHVYDHLLNINKENKIDTVYNYMGVRK